MGMSVVVNALSLPQVAPYHPNMDQAHVERAFSLQINQSLSNQMSEQKYFTTAISKEESVFFVLNTLLILKLI